MFRSYATLASVILAVSAAPVCAQATLAAPQYPSSGSMLRSGTPVILRMSESLITEGKKLRVGQRFQMEVAEAVTLNGQVVIPAGSPATGEVTDVRNKGMWGKSGGINARVLYVRVDGRQIRLTGQVDDKGVTGTAGVVGALVFVPVAGFFVTGTSARIPVGAPVKAFVDEDIAVTFAQVQPPQPVMVVPAAAAPAPGEASARIQPAAMVMPVASVASSASVRVLSPYEQGRQQGLAAVASGGPR